MVKVRSLMFAKSVEMVGIKGLIPYIVLSINNCNKYYTLHVLHISLCYIHLNK